MEGSARYLNLLQDDNKIVRRDGVKSLHAEAVSDPSSISLYAKPLVNLLSDPVEKTRELSYELLIVAASRSELTPVLPSLIPALVSRLGQPELNEPSEEVRLLGVDLIGVLVETVEGLNPFVDDMISILANTVADPYHTVRIKSCSVVSRLGTKTRPVFHYNSERLMRPLAISISHQQWRVREAVVNCIGDVILLGSHKSVDLILSHLTQRLFDPSAVVRKAVVTVVASWLMEFVDRYSYFHKFIPLIMTGLCDESPEVEQYADESWRQVGKKFLDENEEEYKDQIDFQTQQPQHYPKDVKRPNLGCRLLTWQHAIKILPGIGHEISDWVVSTRVKSAQLLYHIILNCEDRVTMHVEKIFHTIYRASQDDDSTVVNYSLRSAKLIGCFVPLNVTWTILSSAVTFGATEGNLRVLAAVLEGGEEELVPFIPQVGPLLADSAETLKPKVQAALMDVCQVVLAFEIPPETSLPYFKTLVTVLAMAEDERLKGRAKELLEKLGEHHSSLDNLMAENGGSILTEMKLSSADWTPVSPSKLIFEVFLAQGGIMVERNMGTILDILITNLSPSKDPQVRLRFFTMLARQILNYNQANHSAMLQDFVKQVIEDVLSPNLAWKAGKTAGALRTAAASCLLAILQGNILDSGIMADLGPRVIASLLALIEEGSETLRLIVCQSIQKIVSTTQVEPDVVNKIYPAMLKRMDDVSDDVRVTACYTIAKLFSNLPPSYDLNFYKAHIQHAYSTLLVHMDDEGVEDVVQDVLTIVGSRVLPSLLIEECEKIKGKHRSTARCDGLVQALRNVSL